MTATTALTGTILVSVGDQPASEVATFEVPVIANTTYATTETPLEVGDIRGAMASALRRAADEMEAGR